MGITSRGFQVNPSAKHGSLFGRGVYLAESCMKSDEYTSPDPTTMRKLRPLLLCRAALGNVLYTDKEIPDGEELRKECEPKDGITQFHSVLGDRQKASGTYREFVAYNSSQVYPAYILWYERVFLRIDEESWWDYSRDW